MRSRVERTLALSALSAISERSNSTPISGSGSWSGSQYSPSGLFVAPTDMEDVVVGSPLHDCSISRKRLGYPWWCSSNEANLV
jgi:hypothetical protein